MIASERETIIRWDEETKEVNVYTASPTMMNKLRKLAEKCPEKVIKVSAEKYEGKVIAENWTLPNRKWVSLRISKAGTLTAEQKAKIVEQMNRAAQNAF